MIFITHAASPAFNNGDHTMTNATPYDATIDALMSAPTDEAFSEILDRFSQEYHAARTALDGWLYWSTCAAELI